jgi:hypothetical protein
MARLIAKCKCEINRPTLTKKTGWQAGVACLPYRFFRIPFQKGATAADFLPLQKAAVAVDLVPLQKGATAAGFLPLQRDTTWAGHLPIQMAAIGVGFCIALNYGQCGGG